MNDKCIKMIPKITYKKSRKGGIMEDTDLAQALLVAQTEFSLLP